MKMDGKSSYIRNAQKKQYGEKDIPDKFKVIDFLRQYEIYGLTDMCLLFLKEYGTFLGAYKHTFINDRSYFFQELLTFSHIILRVNHVTWLTAQVHIAVQYPYNRNSVSRGMRRF